MSKRANGEGSITKHGSRWKAVIVIGYRNGKPIRRTKTVNSKAEARRAISELKAKYAGGVSEFVTISEFFAQWMAENENRKLSKRTNHASRHLHRWRLFSCAVHCLTCDRNATEENNS